MIQKKYQACLIIVALISLAGCAATVPVDQCIVNPRSNLDGAIRQVEDKLADGCAYSFNDYFAQLLEVAADDSASENKRRFSDFLVRTSDQGIISKRQAKSIYNRYFNVKFVSLAGDYNTCSQTCPVRARVIADMQVELLDKEVGLVQVSEDSVSYYRADHLLKEAQLVLEATCRACEAGGL